MLISILFVSCFFQLVAAYLALRLIGPSGGRRAWILIAVAFVLRSMRLVYELYLYLRPDIPYQLLLLDEVLGLTVSILSALGVYWIGPLFEAFRTAEREREMYVHSISHDLRTPLTVIQGYAELLRGKLRSLSVDEEGQQAAEAILQGSARMNALIQDLTDAARTEGGQLVLARQPLELHAYLPALTGSVSRQDRERLRFHVPPGFPPVMADPERLSRVLLNLISNGLKYSPPETPIEIEVRREGADALIAVRDRGKGIAPKNLPHLFDRFYRVRGSADGGIGLGLYIARILVEAHGGRIWAESRPGQGSTFFFTLPFAGR